jgi:hypothetical protein
VQFAFYGLTGVRNARNVGKSNLPSIGAAAMDQDAINDLARAAHRRPRLIPLQFSEPVSARTIDEERKAARDAHAVTLTALIMLTACEGTDGVCRQVALTNARAAIALAKGQLT